MSTAAQRLALTAAQNAKDYTALAAALAAISAADAVQTGSVEGQDLSADAINTVKAAITDIDGGTP